MNSISKHDPSAVNNEPKRPLSCPPDNRVKQSCGLLAEVLKQQKDRKENRLKAMEINNGLIIQENILLRQKLLEQENTLLREKLLEQENILESKKNIPIIVRICQFPFNLLANFFTKIRKMLKIADTGSLKHQKQPGETIVTVSPPQTQPALPQEFLEGFKKNILTPNRYAEGNWNKLVQKYRIKILRIKAQTIIPAPIRQDNILVNAPPPLMSSPEGKRIIEKYTKNRLGSRVPVKQPTPLRYSSTMRWT